MQEKIYYNFVLFGTSITCIISELLFSIFSFKNDNLIKYLSVGIYTQTVFSTLLNVWKNYFVAQRNETEIINLKIWSIVSITVCISLIIIMLLKNKILYIILSITTILQISYTIIFSKAHTLDNIYSIFQCVHGIMIYIILDISFNQIRKVDNTQRNLLC